MEFTFGNAHPSPPVIPFYATINGGSQSIAFGQMGTGGVDNVFCGNAVFGAPPTKCNMQSSGVIPKEIINGDPNMIWYDHFFINAFVNSGMSLTWARRKGTIQVSYDKSLLNSQLPAESANCKSCYYGQATGWAADPINTNTGALSYSINDLEIPTSAGPLKFGRAYISSLKNEFTSPLGYGWVHNQDIRLIFPAANEPGFVHFKDPSGNLYRFWYAKDPNSGTERYSPYAGYTASLTKNPGTPTTYTLKDQSQNIYTFNQNGKITSLANSTGQIFNYTYDTNGRLDLVSADGGTRYFHFLYNPQGQLDSVTDHTGHSISFSYNPSGDLESYTDVLDKTWGYEYLDHLLTRIVDSNNNIVERNEYYPDGKAWKQFDGEGNLVAEIQYTANNPTPPPLYSFDFETGDLTGWTVVSGNAFSLLDVTNLTTAQGGNNETFGQHGNYHLWGYKDGGDGQIGVLQSDTVTLPANPTVRVLVAGGGDINNLYVALVRASDGVELFKATGQYSEFYRQISWDASAYAGQNVYIKAVDNSTGGWGHVNIDNVEIISMPSTPIPALTTTVTDARGNITTHDYDSKGVLIEETDPLDAQTQKNYDGNFRPDSVQDALGNPPTTLTWSDDGTNLEYVKDALNNETFISYNSTNNPTSVIDPLSHETKYFYNDPNFPTLPTRVEYPLSFDGGTTFVGTDYEYYPPSSGASTGKVKFVTDALGHQTHYTYTSSGQTETVTIAYGTLQAQTITYSYDNLGRLVDTTDEQGVVTHNQYDAAGRLLKTTRNYVPSRPQNDENKYNLVTEYRYDARSNLIAVIDTYGVITRTYYDLADRPVTVVQNLVGQTIETGTPPVGGSGITDENIRTDTVYDDIGNVIAVIDPDGVITRTYYDEANRPVTLLQNLIGQAISVNTPPTYNPAFPERNIRTDTVYDANGNVIASIDTHSVITRTYYDQLNRPKTVVQNLTGQAISVATPPGRGTTSNIRTDTYYDANGNVIATVDPKNVITRTYHDALNRPITVVQNLVGQTIINPDPPAAGTGATEANIRTDTYYDEAGNVIATVDPSGVVNRTYYDDANRSVTTVRNLVGQNIYVTTPPARGNGQSEVNARTDTTYDSFGRRDTVRDPLGRDTKYTYDELGQLLKATVNFLNGGVPQNDQDQRNIVTEYAYDALGRQLRTTDTLGRVTQNTYNDLSRLLTTTQNYLQGQAQNYKDALGDQYNLIITFTYDVRGNQIAITDTKGMVTRTYYDALGRSTTVVRNLTGSISTPTPPARGNPPSALLNLRTDTLYLGTGNVDLLIDEMGETTDYGYDALGRLITSLDPLSHETTFEYDANGNRTKMINAETVATRYEYDALNRLKAVVENYRAGINPDNETNVRTEYTYDAGGNRLSILDGNNHSTSFTYNSFGQVKTETDALGNIFTHSYNVMGDRISLLDANNKTTTFGYDELNRLTLINYPSPDTDVTFDYDPIGRRQFMNDGLGTTTWNHNNLDLPKSITDPFSAQVSYDYDAVGNRTTLTYPDSRAVNYGYNALNQLTSAATTGIGSTGYGYDAAGHLKSVTRPNGVTSAYNYLNNGWLQDITHTSGAGTLASYQYQYDNVGNRIQAIENILSPSQPPTATPTTPPTSTPTATNTLTPTATPSQTQTFTPGPTATHTFTPSPTNTTVPTDTPSQTPTFTNTPGGATSTLTATPVTYTYTSQPNGTDGVDTYLQNSSPTTNFGTDVAIAAGENNNQANRIARSLIKFDLSSIPANAVITSATLSLWTANDLSDNNRTIRVYRLKRAFNESQATWNVASTGVNWEVAGASGANDRESTDIGSIQILANEAIGVEKQITLTSAQIQEMVSGTFTNNGFIIVADTELNDRFNYKSSDSTTAAQRPKLVVQYTLPQGHAPSIHFALSGAPVETKREGGQFVNYMLPKAQPLQQDGTYTSQPNGTDGVDTYLQNSSPTTNFGTDVAIAAGENNNQANRIARSLIKFDLSSIPANAVITSATLSLWTANDLSDNTRTIRVFRLKTAFNESQATWNIASTGVNWQTAGASGANDREGTDIGSVQILANEAIGVEKQISLTSAQIQEMVSGTFTNNGFIIVADTELNDRFNYKSSDSTTATNRPKLFIQYTVPPTNTPSHTPTLTVTPSPTFTPTQTPSLTPTLPITTTPSHTFTPTPSSSGPITINYVYDPLYRLKEANYSTGDYYHYTYDAVGNRLTQNTLLSGVPLTTNYLYDNANRIQSVNSVTYTFDANGNLLNDGVNTYTYDSANRLKTITGASAATFAYNGLGDRLSQNGVNYTLDLNAGLTQVLSDGTNTYLYGVGRIAQVNTTTEYFLGDALESVRQLANTSGNFTLTKSYAPYGDLAQSVGTVQTNYGFTGEFTDSSGLIYLRSRYYTPGMGRFLTKDSWMGDYNRPLSLNRWMYVEGNPVNYTDPSGHIACQDIIPSWRPIFVALHLCDPQVNPTLSSSKIEYYEQLQSFPFVIDGQKCAIGLVFNGYVCVPVEDDVQCFNPGPLIVPNVYNNQKRLSKHCERILVALQSALSAVIGRYWDWVDNRRGRRDVGHIKSYLQAQIRLRAALVLWDRYNCGPLPSDVEDAWDWVGKPLP